MKFHPLTPATCLGITVGWSPSRAGRAHGRRNRHRRLPDVIKHYNAHPGLKLSDEEVAQLAEYLKSL